MKLINLIIFLCISQLIISCGDNGSHQAAGLDSKTLFSEWHDEDTNKSYFFESETNMVLTDEETGFKKDCELRIDGDEFEGHIEATSCYERSETKSKSFGVFGDYNIQNNTLTLCQKAAGGGQVCTTWK